MNNLFDDLMMKGLVVGGIYRTPALKVIFEDGTSFVEMKPQSKTEALVVCFLGFEPKKKDAHAELMPQDVISALGWVLVEDAEAAGADKSCRDAMTAKAKRAIAQARKVKERAAPKRAPRRKKAVKP